MFPWIFSNVLWNYVRPNSLKSPGSVTLCWDLVRLTKILLQKWPWAKSFIWIGELTYEYGYVLFFFFFFLFWKIALPSLLTLKFFSNHFSQRDWDQPNQANVGLSSQSNAMTVLLRKLHCCLSSLFFFPFNLFRLCLVCFRPKKVVKSDTFLTIHEAIHKPVLITENEIKQEWCWVFTWIYYLLSLSLTFHAQARFWQRK